FSVDPRQIHLERAAFAYLGVDPDITTALLDDAVYGGQPEARSLARFLGRKEWLKDALADRFVHAHAVVGHRQHHIGARFGAHMVAGKVLIKVYISGLDQK